jgi:hypothetical protein
MALKHRHAALDVGVHAVHQAECPVDNIGMLRCEQVAQVCQQSQLWLHLLTCRVCSYWLTVEHSHNPAHMSRRQVTHTTTIWLVLALAMV